MMSICLSCFAPCPGLHDAPLLPLVFLFSLIESGISFILTDVLFLPVAVWQAVSSSVGSQLRLWATGEQPEGGDAVATGAIFRF